MKTTASHLFESPHTGLGKWSVGLSLFFVVLLLIVTNDILPFSGLLTMLIGWIAFGLSLGAILWKKEHSWLIWLMLIPGLFAVLFTLGEIFVPH